MLNFIRGLVIVALACCAPVGAQMTLTGVGSGGIGSASCTFSTISFTGGSLGAASLSRSSSATYINSSGVLSTAASNAARFNYDSNYPAGNAAPSLTGPFLLVEPAATNIFLQSNAFNTTPWTPSITMVSGIFTSPDGTLDGWSGQATSSFQDIEQSVTTSTGAYTVSIWGKYIVSTATLLAQLNGNVGSTINLTTSLERVSSTITPGSGTAEAAVFMQATGTNGFFGSQLETGSVSTSYIATTTGTGSRSADVVTFTQPSGCGHNTYTFDDNSTQIVSQAAGTATVPTNLNRPNIKSIAGST